MELYAGNEHAHRHVRLPGLEGDVIALPSDAREGGDLYALFSCGDARYARIVLADAAGHGFSASSVAAHVHGLLHKHSDVRDIGALLAALNETFEASVGGAPLRLVTVATANYDHQTGEFNYAYAAQPRMLWWVLRDRQWLPLGEELDGLPLGVIAGEVYSQQSVRLDPGDMIMAFSDALTEVTSPAGEQLSSEGFRRLAESVSRDLPHLSVHDFSEALLDQVRRYHGSGRFDDDLTLLTLHRLE